MMMVMMNLSIAEARDGFLVLREFEGLRKWRRCFFHL